MYIAFDVKLTASLTIQTHLETGAAYFIKLNFIEFHALSVYLDKYSLKIYLLEHVLNSNFQKLVLYLKFYKISCKIIQ